MRNIRPTFFSRIWRRGRKLPLKNLHAEINTHVLYVKIPISNETRRTRTKFSQKIWDALYLLLYGGVYVRNHHHEINRDQILSNIDYKLELIRDDD